MKGVSEIVSAVVVFAVSVGVMSLYAQWAPDFAGDTVNEIGDQSNQKIRCDNAAISIQDPLYDRSGDILEFDVENTGTIRLSGGLHAGAFNSSLEINRTVISQLGVGETQTVRINSDRIPDMILVTSDECPEVGGRETIIQVRE